METGARDGQEGRGGVERVGPKNYMYTKVIPRRLRNSARPPDGASPPAHLNPVTHPNPTCSPHLNPACPSVSKQPTPTCLSVTAELKSTVSLEGPGHPHPSDDQGISPAECVQGTADSLLGGQTAKRQNASLQKTSSDSQMDVLSDDTVFYRSCAVSKDSSRSNRPKIYYPNDAQSSVIQQNCPRSDHTVDCSGDNRKLTTVSKANNVPCGDDGFSLTVIDDDDEGEGGNKDDGYCALRRCSTSSEGGPWLAKPSAGFAGKRRWTSERRRHKEEWCPLVLQEKRHQRSESSLDTKGPIWKAQYGNTSEGSPSSVQYKQQGQASLAVDVCDVKRRGSGSGLLTSSAPAYQEFREAEKKTLTLEEACQLVFPHVPEELRQTESSHVSEDRHADARLQPRVEGRYTDTRLQPRNEDICTDAHLPPRIEGRCTDTHLPPRIEDRCTDTRLQPGNEDRCTDTRLQPSSEDRRAGTNKGKKPEASSPSDTLDIDHHEVDHNVYQNLVGTTETTMKPTADTTDFVLTLTGTGTLITVTSERERSEDKVQAQGEADEVRSPTPSFHSEGAPSSRQRCTTDNGSLPTRSNSSTALVEDESRAVDILRSCSACLEACRDVRVMQCFHLLCEGCILAHDDEDSAQCGLCGAQQTVAPQGVPLLRDLFPGLFDAVPSCVEPMPPAPPASQAEGPPSCSQRGDREHKQGSTESGLNFSEATASLKAEKTSTGLGTGVRRDAEDDEAPSKVGSPAGPVTDVLQTVALDQPDKSFPRESPSGKTKQASTAFVSSSPSQELSIDSSDNDNCSTTSRSDSSENTSSGHEHDRLSDKEPRNSPLGTKDANKGRGITGSLQQLQTCGACHVHGNLRHACVTCGGIGLCAGCHVAHTNLPVTRNHEVVAMSPSSPSPLSVSPLTLLSHLQPLCAAHGQDLALQCRTCAQLLCHRCLTPRHVSHEVRELGQLQHAGHKQFCVLKRGIKQHALTAKSSHRAVNQQLDKVALTRQNVRQAIHDSARRRLQTLTSETQHLTCDVEASTQGVVRQLTASLQDLAHVQREGERLRCLVNSVRDDTPHLTQLIINNTCQVWFDQLRQRKSLQVGEVQSVAFCPDLTLEDQLAAPSTLGRVSTLATTIPDTRIVIRAVFKTPGGVSALAITPYKEVVCVSSPARCQVWDQHYGVMLSDVSRHVTEPTQVKVTPNGILVILGLDVISKTARVTYLSPSGSFLSAVPLSSPLRHTHMDCPTHSRLLVSDGEKKTITLYGLDHHTDPICLTLLRQISNDPAVSNPRHLTITVTGDWLFNDQGYFMRVASPEGHVTTVLTEDEPEAILQPPRSSWSRCCRRMLSDVCCDTWGRMMTADSGKNGLYLVTSGSVGGGERHFVSLQDLMPSGYVTAMTVDKDDDVVLGMSDGTVYVLSIGLEEDIPTSASLYNVNE